MNNEKIKDRYFMPALPTLSIIINSKIEAIVISMASEEFVKEISYPKASIGTKVFISNCDKGLAKYISH